jgi:hypothetical protein
MRKTQLLTLKEAAAALGIDEKSVLVAGQLKGEKKSEWLQDKWYVYKGAVDDLVSQQKRDKTDSPPTQTGSNPKTVPEQSQTFDLRSIRQGVSIETEGVRAIAHKSTIPWLSSERDRLQVVVEQVMRPLIEKVASQAQMLAEKDRIIEEQSNKLKLLPDLEKHAAAEREARETIVNLLQERNLILERESKQSELSKEKVGELKSALERLEQVEVENKAAAEREIERLKKEKETQVANLEDQLGFLAFQLEQAQRPWWKKWFSGASPVYR